METCEIQNVINNLQDWNMECEIYITSPLTLLAAYCKINQANKKISSHNIIFC